MVEGILGEDIKMGDDVWNDVKFLEKVKEICVDNHIKKIEREVLKEFLEKVKAILVNNPNEFITIKEIANDNAIKEILEKKWNLCSDPDYAVRWFLCHPICCLSPYILCLEGRTHADYAQLALKYSPDKQKNYQDRREDLERIRLERIRQLKQKWRQSSRKLRQLIQDSYDAIIRDKQEWRQSNQKLRQLTQDLYDAIIREMVKFFPDFEGEEELRRQDKLLDEFEEGQKRLKRSLHDEERGEPWR